MKKKIRYHLAPLQRSKKFRLPQWKQLPVLLSRSPPLGDLVKAAAAIGPVTGEWSKKHNMSKAEKHKNP